VLGEANRRELQTIEPVEAFDDRGRGHAIGHRHVRRNFKSNAARERRTDGSKSEARSTGEGLAHQLQRDAGSLERNTITAQTGHALG
jgi:hypothetical protein